MDSIRSVAQLIDYCGQGQRPKYLFFWGHQPRQDGSIGKSCLSQWFDAPFEIDGIRYRTAEHYMMAEKARLFGDHATLAKILKAAQPGAVKKLGREIQGFNDEVWNAHRFSIVTNGNQAKFSQHPALQTFLLDSGDRILVEASPADKIWGIGLAETDAAADNPSAWKGLNLLGFALMEARALIRAAQ
jgi:ribA/ribD-fused uncharacterized protein